MAYNQKERLAKMGKAKSTEEIRALIMELPDRGPAITEEEREFFTMERWRTSNSSIRTIPDGKTLTG
jgi:hypothetical protein